MLHIIIQIVNKNVTFENPNIKIFFFWIISENVTNCYNIPLISKKARWNKLELNSKEQKCFDVINKVVNKELTRKEAMFELNKSRQKIYRLINIYYSEGKNGFIHKNRGKTSKNKIDRKIIEELEQLYLNEYYDYNFEAFYDELQNKYNYKISYDVILKEFKRFQ